MKLQETIKEALRIIEQYGNPKKSDKPLHPTDYSWALRIMPTMINHLTYDLKVATDRIKFLEGRLEHHKLEHINYDDYNR